MIEFETEREKRIWLAGIVDSEGSLVLSKSNRPKNLRGYRYNPELTVSGSNLEFMLAVKEAFDCAHISDARPDSGCYHVGLSSNCLHF